MPLIKSISGIRGTIGNRKGEDLTKDDIVLYTKSFVLWLQSENRIINNNNTKKYFACLINNIGSKFQVEFYGRSINKVEKPSWYVFPWEIES